MKRLMLFCAITALGYCASVAGEPAPQPRYLVTFERPFWVRIGDGYFLAEAAEGWYDSSREWVTYRSVYNLSELGVGPSRSSGFWKDTSDGSFHVTRVIVHGGTPYEGEPFKVWARTVERQEIKP